MKHAVFDCETLGIGSNAVVLSIGAVVYDFNAVANDETYEDLINTGFHVKFDVKEQAALGRKIEDETLNWWAKQSDEAKLILRASDADVTMKEGLTLLNEWLRSSGYDYKKSYCWSRGTYFDFPKFYSMYGAADIAPGFNGWKIRDTRTMIDCLTGVDDGAYTPLKGVPKAFKHHNALHDAALDAYRMIEIVENLK